MFIVFVSVFPNISGIKFTLYVQISTQRETIPRFLRRTVDVGVPSASEYLSEDA